MTVGVEVICALIVISLQALAPPPSHRFSVGAFLLGAGLLGRSSSRGSTSTPGPSRWPRCARSCSGARRSGRSCSASRSRRRSYPAVFLPLLAARAWKRDGPSAALRAVGSRSALLSSSISRSRSSRPRVWRAASGGNSVVRSRSRASPRACCSPFTTLAGCPSVGLRIRLPEPDRKRSRCRLRDHDDSRHRGPCVPYGCGTRAVTRRRPPGSSGTRPRPPSPLSHSARSSPAVPRLVARDRRDRARPSRDGRVHAARWLACLLDPDVVPAKYWELVKDFDPTSSWFVLIRDLVLVASFAALVVRPSGPG